MKYFIAVILFVLFNIENAKAVDDINFYKITTSQGLSHNTVYSIVQDKKGFMWFGTREGLNRFDSDNIITYYANPDDSLSLASNHITALEISPDGSLYVGTSNGLNIYNDKRSIFERINFEGSNIGYVNKIFTNRQKAIFICTNQGLFVQRNSDPALKILIPNINILDLVEIKKGIYWASSLSHIYIINDNGEIINRYNSMAINAQDSIDLRQNISCLFKDSFGNVWVGTKRKGLFKYDEKNERFNPVFKDHQYNSLEVNVVRAISEDQHNNLWVGTESGLFIYDRKKENFKRFSQSFDKSLKTLNDKAIYSIYRSGEGIMWLGTYFGGVNMVSTGDKGFYSLKADGGINALSGKAISHIIEDKQEKIWIASEDGGVNIWDRSKNTFQYLRNKPNKNSLSVDNVHALYEDDDGKIWIGTFLGGLNKYDPTTGEFKVYNNSNISAFTNNMVYAIHRDSQKTLWIGTQAGLNIFDPVRQNYIPFMPEVFNGKFIYEIYEDRAGGLWICVMNSNSLYYFNPVKDELKEYKYSTLNLPPNNLGVVSALEDSKGRMWFGTINQGLVSLDTSTNIFESYTINEGLPNNFVYGILEDNKENLWLSTNKGISKFDTKEISFSNFDISHGLANNQSNFKSAFKAKDGWMFFGTINGLTYFHPDSLALNDIAPEIYFTDFKLFNNSVPISDNSILTTHIDQIKSITLKHEENVITFEFSAINYFSLGINKYAYYLEGFESDWNYVGDKKSATYTNLSPGNYTFKVKAANNDGLWSEDAREIKIVILPPFWMTNWAMAGYVLLVVGLILLYRTFLNYRNREKMAIQIERMEREKITEINKHKINFFTYISHEFKTPLTLIIASIDKFLMDSSINQDNNRGYNLIKRNAKRLHFLIDQLMEFRKIEADHAKINYSKGDIILFLKDTFNAFTPLFTKKKMEFHFISNIKSYSTYFDSDKLEKIITNLISNAVKYTSAEGLIKMEINIFPDTAGDDNIEIWINDTGHGIDTKEIEKVFSGFYQTNFGKSVPAGTGIGLALVKSLVQFLKGRIEINSSLYNGTSIRIMLPLKNELKDQQVCHIDGNKTIDIEHEFSVESGKSANQELNSGSNHEYKLLIVEDNKEINKFLADHFCGSYKIIQAANGKDALEKLEKDMPDVIVSDIMMPEMDGITLCQHIKSNIHTSHIPVVLLTAKAKIESRIEGLDVGADYYMPKPFNQRELELIIKNLLESRNRLKNHFLKFGSIKDVDVTLNNRDQDFLLNLTSIVEEHLEDSDFNITTFVKEAGVSRTLLHLKLKKLVNLSASEFIKNIRLNHAIELLKKSDLSVSEIAYKVGFSDPNYFSRSFKEKYKVNPTRYRENFNEDTNSSALELT